MTADCGTLYRMTDGRALKLEIVRNDTLGIAMGGTKGVKIPYPPLPLFGESSGEKNMSMVAAWAVHNDKSVNIADAYSERGV